MDPDKWRRIRGRARTFPLFLRSSGEEEPVPMLRRNVPLVLATVLIALAPVRAGAEEERKSQKPDEFLLSWVNGAAEYDLFRELHAKFPQSPHKRASEEMEVAVKCFALRRECGEERAASLTAELLDLHRASGGDPALRRRVLHVLGRLRSPGALPLLCESAGTSAGDLQETAIEALGFFGTAPGEDPFVVFGGRLFEVDFPPADAPEATETLLGLLEKLRDARPASARLPDRTEEDRRFRWLSFEVLRALRSHRRKSVADAAIETLTGNHRVGPEPLWEDLGELLSRNLGHVDLAKLLELLGDERPPVRRAAARALGWTGRPAAVAPLLARLDDPDARVREEADHALTRLSGSRPDPLLREGRKTAGEWARVLGPRGERLDPASSLEPEDREPGIYRYGR
jgi:hypothetical protein